MSFTERRAKGLSRCLVETGTPAEKLTMHISELAPHTRSHATHTHDAIEAFYVFEGQAIVEIGGERHAVGPNEALILSARTLHGLANPGDVAVRYLVVIAAE